MLKVWMRFGGIDGNAVGGENLKNARDCKPVRNLKFPVDALCFVCSKRNDGVHILHRSSWNIG